MPSILSIYRILKRKGKELRELGERVRDAPKPCERCGGERVLRGQRPYSGITCPDCLGIGVQP